MRDNPLRQLIGSIESGEGSWRELLVRLDELSDASVPDSSAVRAEVLTYLDDTATLLDTLAVAVEAGRVDWIEVLDAAHGYLGNRDDLVTDDEGVLGILDDAYVCRALIRKAATTAEDSPVYVADLPAEAVVRAVLGAPVTATLDVAAAQTVLDIRTGRDA
jgi:hypothetical protein